MRYNRPHCRADMPVRPERPESVMRPCPAHWLLILVVVLLGTASLLAGCGKKGPLYLPDQQTRTAAPTVSPEP